MRRRVVSCALTLGSILLMSGPARAASLSDQLDRFLQDNAGLRAGEFDQSMHPFADTAVPVLQKLEVRGADFPVTSTSPGFSFRYNPELGMFEPATASLGPVFVDRADTLGRGRLDVGATYLFARLTELQGGDLNTSSDTHDLANVFRNGTFSTKKDQNGLPR